MKPICIDGSQGEGGGQIVRTALAWSVLEQVAVVVEGIRSGRPKPGLKAQHAGILRLLHDMTGAEVHGGEVGSSRLAFRPGTPRPGCYDLDVGTAGSIPLVLQTLLPVALAAPAPVELRLVGGTDVAWGPTLAWFEHVLLHRLAGVGRVELVLERRGFYPRGGGVVRLRVEGPGTSDGLRDAVVEALGADRTGSGRPVAMGGVSVAHTELADRGVADRQAAGAKRLLSRHLLPRPRFDIEAVDADSLGSAVSLWLDDDRGNRIGADGLGRRGVRAEEVGWRAALDLVEDWQTGATVDRHLADHWVPWVALGAGAVRVPRLTGHLETNVAVVNQLLAPGESALECTEDLVLRRTTA